MTLLKNDELRKQRQRERRERLRKAAAELRAAFCDLYDISTVDRIYLGCSLDGDRPYHFIGATHCDNSSGYLLEYDPSTKKGGVMTSLPRVKKAELLDAIREGVRAAMWDMITNATSMPCADFYATLEEGIAIGIERGILDKGRRTTS